MNTIIKNYLDAGHFDRFYDEHSDLVEMDPYTVERAGAALIGRDLQRLCSHKPLEKMKQILERELQLVDASLFFQQMAGAENMALAMELVRIMLSNMK
jgi:predicted nucleotidyltransferase